MRKGDWQTLFRDLYASIIFVSYKIALISIFVSSIYFMGFTWFSMIFILTAIFFIALMDRELVNFALKRQMAYSPDKQLRKLVSNELNGWYDDPFIDGSIKRERLWENGVWTSQTRPK